MDNLLTQARSASRDPRECRQTMDALNAIGFDSEAFKLLHHLRDTGPRFYRYSKRIALFDEDDNNHRVHQRLLYVLLSCPDGAPPKGKSYQSLAMEAMNEIPLIMKKSRND